MPYTYKAKIYRLILSPWFHYEVASGSRINAYVNRMELNEVSSDKWQGEMLSIIEDDAKQIQIDIVEITGYLRVIITLNM